LVDDLIKAAGSGDISGDLREGFDYDAIRNLYANVDDFNAAQVREYADDHGIELPDAPKGDPDYETDDSRHGWLTEAREACREFAQENPAEVYEWWRVSGWLCDKLHQVGEVTIDNGYGHWWGRTCTGQAWIMDGTLQRVAALFED
jgi:hypothetical protein